MKEYISILCLSSLAAILVYELAKKSWGGTVRASSLMTLLGVSIFSFFDLGPINAEIPAIIFGASFVGMTAPARLRREGVVLSAIVFSLLFLSLNPLLKGMGGALGLSAFLSVSFVYFFAKIKHFR